jgi:hypothetical protein
VGVFARNAAQNRRSAARRAAFHALDVDPDRRVVCRYGTRDFTTGHRSLAVRLVRVNTKGHAGQGGWQGWAGWGLSGRIGEPGSRTHVDPRIRLDSRRHVDDATNVELSCFDR